MGMRLRTRVTMRAGIGIRMILGTGVEGKSQHGVFDDVDDEDD
jgi:hypothetical protein